MITQGNYSRAGIGPRDGKMLPSDAAAPAGAGFLSVLVFPAARKGFRPVSGPAAGPAGRR